MKTKLLFILLGIYCLFSLTTYIYYHGGWDTFYHLFNNNTLAKFQLMNTKQTKTKPNTHKKTKKENKALLVPSEKLISIPIKIYFPKFNKQYVIVGVGVDDTNSMEIPIDFQTVGWYKLGVRPGQKGAALLNGHYDTTEAKPAAFYNLSTMVPGDEIIIETEDGNNVVFVVETLTSQNETDFPKEIVYGSFDGIGLKLITCDGYWDKVKKIYTKRLIVSARLKN